VVVWIRPLMELVLCRSYESRKKEEIGGGDDAYGELRDMLAGVIESAKARENKAKTDPDILIQREFWRTPRLLELSEALLELITGNGSLL
jgi:hypothetical protein